MLWHVDRLGKVMDKKAASCLWSDTDRSLTISTRILRDDGVNITAAIQAVCTKYVASFAYQVDRAKVSLSLTMKFPPQPQDIYNQLEEIAVIICKLLWGCPADTSEGESVDSLIKMPAYMPVAGSFPVAYVATALPPGSEPGSRYQALYEQLMKERTTLAEMELNQVGDLAEKIKVAGKPIIGKKATELNKAALADKAALVDRTIAALQQQDIGWPAQFLSGPAYAKLKLMSEATQATNPTKNIDSPSAIELATVELEDIDREC